MGAITIRGIAIDSANLVLQTGPISKELRDTLDAQLAVQERIDEYIQALRLTEYSTLVFLHRLPIARTFRFTLWKLLADRPWGMESERVGIPG